MLIQALYQGLAERREVWLDVDGDNLPARALYASCGFREQFVQRYFALELGAEEQEDV